MEGFSSIFLFFPLIVTPVTVRITEKIIIKIRKINIFFKE